MTHESSWPSTNALSDHSHSQMLATYSTSTVQLLVGGALVNITVLVGYALVSNITSTEYSSYHSARVGKTRAKFSLSTNVNKPLQFFS